MLYQKVSKCRTFFSFICKNGEKSVRYLQYFTFCSNKDVLQHSFCVDKLILKSL